PRKHSQLAGVEAVRDAAASSPSQQAVLLHHVDFYPAAAEISTPGWNHSPPRPRRVLPGLHWGEIAFAHPLPRLRRVLLRVHGGEIAFADPLGVALTSG